MEPTLILMAVRAAARLGHAGEQAIGRYARDREVLLPLVERIAVPDAQKIAGEFSLHPELVTEQLRPYWESFRAKPGAPRLAGDFDVLAAEFARTQARKSGGDATQADEVAAIWMVKQWSASAQPPGPIAHITLTIVDVAAEFAAREPRLFGADGNAELLLKAFATRIADLVPDDVEHLGARNVLGRRLTGLFLRSALGSLSEVPEALIEEAHVQRLVRNTLPQLLQAFPSGGEEVQWSEVLETLIGPVAAEAMKALALSPQQFFGSKFEDEDLLGVLTRTYLLKAAEIGLGDLFTKTGAVQLYKATLQLAAQRPDLFLGDSADAAHKLIANLFRDLAAALDAATPTIDEQLIAPLAATALETIAREASGYLDASKPWQNVLSATLVPMITTVAEALRRGNSTSLRRVLGGAQLHDFVRVMIGQIAKTPGMVTSTDHREVNALVKALAEAMTTDEHALLSQADWIAVVAAVVEEVAANPGRLIQVDDSAQPSILENVLKALLAVAAEQWQLRDRARGAVLFGPTLREAMVLSIRATAGQATAARANAAQLKSLAADITQLVATNAGKYGSKEWLRIYRTLIMQVLETGRLPPVNEALVNAILIAGGK